LGRLPRAYCDRLYGAHIRASGTRMYLEKTPEYSTIWPLVTQVYLNATYILLTWHPGAILSSFAHSFFAGDYREAWSHDPVPARYVPTLAAFLRQSRTPCLHLRYEVLVTDPESCLRQACAHAGLAFEPSIIDYGGAERRPVTNSYGGWMIPLPSIGATARYRKVSISGPRSLPLTRINADFCTTCRTAGSGRPGDDRLSPRNILGAGRCPGYIPSVPTATGDRLSAPSLVDYQGAAVGETLSSDLRLACDVLLRHY